MPHRYAWLLLALLMPAAASAQAPGAALRAWLTGQAEVWRGIERVAVVEDAAWEVDGPNGVQRSHVTTRYTGTPDGEPWQREVLSVEIDGRPVDVERWERMERRRRRLFGRPLERLLQGVRLTPPLLRQLRPLGPPAPCLLAGRRCWRIDLAPRRDALPIERVTLWFARGEPALLQSRFLVRPDPPGPPIRVLTEYARRDGLDVPRFRRVEGSFAMRRRFRTFTTLFSYDAEYTDYRFVRAARDSR